jgi:uncharacterized protein YecT (DUF1311 family)
MTRWPAVIVALAAVSFTAAQAQPAKPKPPAAKPSTNYERCLASASGMSTAGMIECANAELRVQDGRLNNAYQSAILRLERPRQKVALQKAQRAWIAFRDADCAALYDEDWGSMARVQANACVLEHTRRRADELERFRKFD